MQTQTHPGLKLVKTCKVKNEEENLTIFHQVEVAVTRTAEVHSI